MRKAVYLIGGILLAFACEKKKDPSPQVLPRECFSTLSLNLSALEMAGDSLIVDYRVSGTGNLKIMEVTFTSESSVQTLTEPSSPFAQQVIFKDGPPSFSDTADLIVTGQVSDNGEIEASISYTLIQTRNGNRFSSGGVITDICRDL